MHCPYCSHALRVVAGPVATIHTCDSAHGVWLPRDAWPAQVRDAVEPRTADTWPAREFAIGRRRTSHRCPSCTHALLEERSWWRTPVLYCGGCHGVWLHRSTDLAQLLDVRRRVAAIDHRQIARGAPTSSGAVDVDDVVDSLFTLLRLID
jgi:Zn-finger nucleic acid-binding protein